METIAIIVIAVIAVFLILKLLTAPIRFAAKMLINAGITRIVHRGEYPDELSRAILEEAGIEILVME